MGKRNMTYGVILIATMVIVAPGIAFAQTGQTTGHISSQDGAAAPGATVTILETSTRSRLVVQSNQMAITWLRHSCRAPIPLLSRPRGFRP